MSKREPTKHSPAQSPAKKTATDPITSNSYEEFVASIKAQLKDEADYDELVAKIKAELQAEKNPGIVLLGQPAEIIFARNVITESGTLPKPASPLPAPARFDAPEMPRTHELVLDAVTAMLTTGGHSEDVDRLLRSTMAHTKRRTCAGINMKGNEADKTAKEFVQAHIDAWKIDLAAFWSKNQRAPRPEEAKETFTQIIRANLRENVWSYFKEFMAAATVEDQRLMLSVLSGHENRSLPAEHKQDEIYLATAFFDEINRSAEAFLKVPKSMLKQVQAYIDALRAIEQKEA